MNKNLTLRCVIALCLAAASVAMSRANNAYTQCQAATQHTIRNIFTAIPEQIAPMLTPDHCLDLMDLYDSHMAATVKNDWGGKTSLLKLDKHYLLMQDDTDGSIHTEIALLVTGRDSVVCVNRTLHYPMAESTLSFYTTTWQPLDATDYITMPTPSDFTTTPTAGMVSNHSIQAISASISIDANGAASLRMQLNQDSGLGDSAPTAGTTPDADAATPTIIYHWSNHKFARN